MVWHSDKLPFEMGQEDASEGCSPEVWRIVCDTIYNCDGHRPLDIVEYLRQSKEVDEVALSRLPQSVQREIASAAICISPYNLLSTGWSEAKMLRGIQVRAMGPVPWHNWLRYGTIPE
jgi:hypothetical protein